MENVNVNGKEGHLKICVITYPFSNTTKVYTLLFNLIESLEPIASKLHVITGNIPNDEIHDRYTETKINFINFKLDRDFDKSLIGAIALIKWIFGMISSQIKMTKKLFDIRKDFDIVIFFLGPYFYQSPILLAKIFRKKVVVIATVSNVKSAEVDHNRFMSIINKMLDEFNYTLSDCIIADSENVHSLGLNQFINKIAYRPRYVNLDFFKVNKKVEKRGNQVGYIGRFSKEKGITNFVEAIPLILKENKNVNFFIGGGGVLSKEIEEKIRSYQSNKINLFGWVPHDELPMRLNELKLLVIPSYTETGPFIALEAMACGTPVLATKVGLIPHILKDGETGFILDDNSPECICENVIRALEHPNLDEIANNARKVIEERCNYEVAVRKYGEILNKILKAK